MKNTCNVLAFIIGILGLAGSIGFALNSNGNWFSSILYFVLGCLATTLSTVIFLSLAEILEKIEKLDCKIKEMNSNVNIIKDSNSEDIKDKWKCPKCGRLNENHTGSCACGTSRY